MVYDGDPRRAAAHGHRDGARVLVHHRRALQQRGHRDRQARHDADARQAPARAGSQRTMGGGARRARRQRRVAPDAALPCNRSRISRSKVRIDSEATPISSCNIVTVSPVARRAHGDETDRSARWSDARALLPARNVATPPAPADRDAARRRRTMRRTRAPTAPDADGPQIVHDRARADDEHIARAKRRERATERQQPAGEAVGSDTWTTGTSAAGYASISGVHTP